MSDYAAGRTSGVHDGGIGARDGGSPPPLLLGALGAAALIAVLLLVLFSVGGGGDDNAPGGPDEVGAAAAAPIASADGRVRLTVAFEGDGGGRILIAPRTDECTQACAHSFVNGTRVTVTAVPGRNSTFDGWGKACGGRKGCTFVMDRARALTVTFASKPDGLDEVCDGNADEPSYCADGSGTAASSSGDCVDGKDNDGDGLTDAAQDPGCDADDTEADSSPLDDFDETAPPPPPPAGVNDCADGKDNDRDGLTDSAQDPDCTSGTSETGASAPPPPPAATPKATTPSKSECNDGKDNDGDGLIDRAQDPGCEADGSEAGEEP